MPLSLPPPRPLPLSPLRREVGVVMVGGGPLPVRLCPCLWGAEARGAEGGRRPENRPEMAAAAVEAQVVSLLQSQ